MSDTPPLPEPADFRPAEPIGWKSVRGLVALGGIALLATACGPAEDPAIAEGRELYEVNCEICHGEMGLGDGPMAPSLPVLPVSLIEHVGHHSTAEMNRLILGGIPPAMPPHNLSEEQVRLIVGYIWTLVPEDQVVALREMQRQIEEMEQAAGGGAGMGMDHSQMPDTGDDSTDRPEPGM